MIQGIQVKLINKVESGVDGFNNPIYTEKETLVDNVLVTPTTYEDQINELNLSGKKAVYTLAIPKEDTNTWLDADVEFFGERFHIFTPVAKGIDDLIPLSWNGKVRVERYGN